MTNTKLQDLLSLLAHIHATLRDPSREEFCSAFANIQRTLEIPDLEMAKKLEISRPTVGRWATGDCAPHPVGRKPILSYFLGVVERKIGEELAK